MTVSLATITRPIISKLRPSYPTNKSGRFYDAPTLLENLGVTSRILRAQIFDLANDSSLLHLGNLESVISLNEGALEIN